VQISNGDRNPKHESRLGPIASPILTTHAELEAKIASIVFDLVGTNVAVDASLANSGLDSLAAMELRQKLQVSIPDIIKFYTICT
jgi:aryl carrier-like protein